MKERLLKLYHYIVKVLIGTILSCFLCGILDGFGFLINLILNIMIYYLIWPSNPEKWWYDPAEAEKEKWKCYIGLEGEENEWCFKTRYR